MQRVATVAIAVLLLASATVVPAAALGGSSAASSTADGAQSEAYAGTHVSFESSGSAVTDYRVDGTQLFASMETQSQSEVEAESRFDADVSLSAVTNVTGAALSLDASSETSATITAESGATIEAHDSQQGILTVHSGDEAQYTEVELSGDASASAESDDRVVVQSGERSGAFVVAGDGTVATNDDGNVVANLSSESTLVFRSYEGERDEADRQQEQLIADGTATAQVYVDQQAESRVSDVATYSQDVAVETQTQAEGQVSMAVERSSSQGTVVITSVSEGAIATAESADDVAVTIDGEAAASASSYSELKAGIGNEPRYMVRQTGQASASADVLVAVDHFSERNVSVESNGSASGGSGDDGGSDSGSDGGSDGGSAGDSSDGGSSGMPGFGALAALAGLLSAAGLRLRN